MKRGLRSVSLSFFCLCMIFLTSACRNMEISDEFVLKKNEAWRYIAYHPSDEISRTGPIRIRFRHKIIEAEKIGTAIEPLPIHFEPDIPGRATWTSAWAIEFKPDQPLEPGQAYRAMMDLRPFFPEALEKPFFRFEFHTVPRVYDLQTAFLTRDPEQSHIKWQILKGSLLSSDFEDNEMIEKILSARQGETALDIRWTHGPDGKVHQFVIRGIERKEYFSDLDLAWDATFLDVDYKGEMTLSVPALGFFEFIEARTHMEPEPHLSLQFSDPLDPDQDLTGLVHIPNKTLRFEIEENLLRAYSAQSLAGVVTLHAEAGIRNVLGHRIKKRHQVTLIFEEIKPEVRLAGRGVIIPSSEKVLFPFEAVNLTAVDVRIKKIFEDNLPQFFQVNQLSQSREIYRVGKVVLEKKIDLDPEGKLDLGVWNRHALDLSSLVRMDPGALYQVTLAFRKDYSLYTCPDEEEADDGEPEEALGEAGLWDVYESGYTYSYRDRDNPCHGAYYSQSRMVYRNVLSSDLGLLAKRGTDGSLLCVVTDLKTTDPVPDADIKIFDFQHRLLRTLRTDREGFARVTLEDEPFLLIANRQGQRGYLSLKDGHALSMSRFEVGGTTRHQGLRGYIYGERGVWRPGDTIYLTFILEDRDEVIPDDHPVSFELRDPRDQLVVRRVTREGLNGFYAFHAATAPDAPTGNYRATIRVGGALFQKTVKVETVMPNRLKIDFQTAREFLSSAEEDSRASLQVAWFHGAPARRLKTRLDVELSPEKTTFKNYQGFVFDDPGLRYKSEEQTLFDDRIDEAGRAEIPLAIQVNDNAPGRLRARFLCKVFEPGGAFSIDQFSLPFHPYEVYAGLRLGSADERRETFLTDRPHQVDLAAVDQSGSPVPGRRLQLAVYKLSWQWWWDQSAGDLANYNATLMTDPVASGSVETDKEGRAVWRFRVDKEAWGRYLVRVCDPGGHCSGRIIYMERAGWWNRALAEDPGAATMLMFSADRESYAVGDEITLSVPTGEAGRALVSLESGSRVLKAWWVDAVKGSTRVTFQAEPDMVPAVYAHVTLIQPHAQTVNDRPIRMYGVIPISVEDRNTRLQPVLEMPEVLKPEETAQFTVSEKSGRAMTYTVALVDEGLLDLTRFKTPRPWEHFFAREALNVKTWDLFDHVMGAFGATLESLLGIGGGDSGGGPEPGAAKLSRFKPMVLFLGPFHIEAGTTQSHRIPIPRYIGSVRAMVVAGYEGAYGSAEATVPVRRPLMLLGTLPRVLGPGEAVAFPVTVFAMEEGIKNVRVEITSNELLTPEGETRKTVVFDQPGDRTISFPLHVEKMVGAAEIRAVAESGAEKAEFDITLEVRNPNPPLIDISSMTIEGKKALDFDLTPVGMAGTNTGLVEVSAVPPLNLAERLEFLIRYPHGCIEQTTSAVFPQLYLDKLMVLPEEEKQQIEENIRRGIRRIQAFQVPVGGLGYWPGDREPQDWSTSYGGHFMLEAKEKGYNLPAGFFKRWLSYQIVRANAWMRSDRRSDLEQAYRLYLLAGAGQPQLGAMNRFRESRSKNETALWHLAAAYHQAGYPEIALQISRNLSMKVEAYTELSRTYGSDTRDRAMILACLCVLGQREKAGPLVQDLSDKLNTGLWLSTQTTGYTLYALSKYVSGEKNALAFSYRIDEEDWTDVRRELPIEQIGIDFADTGVKKFSLKNPGEGFLYIKTVLRGQPEVPEAAEASDAVSGIQLAVVYRDPGGAEIDPARIVQGTDFFAEITLTHPGERGDYDEMVLTQVVPSGWEILNPRMTRMGGGKCDQPEYQDIRDDRIYSYFDLDRNKKKVFGLTLNASYLGTFYLPPVQVEAMYDTSIYARRGGRWVEVVPAGTGEE